MQQECPLNKAKNHVKANRNAFQAGPTGWPRLVDRIRREREERAVHHTGKQNRDWSAFWTAWSTLVIAIFTVALAIVSYKQWREMENSLALSRQQLELTDRPWIEISDASDSNSLMEGLGFLPNLFVKNVKRQARLGFEIAYKNVGHAAAMHIRISPELYLMDLEHYSENTVVRAEEDRFCNVPLKDVREETSGKSALFPDEPSMSHQIVSADITDAVTHRDEENTFIMPVLIICMDYQYQASARHHQTRAVYDLWDLGKPMPRPHLFGLLKVAPDNMNPPKITLQRVEADDYAD